MEDNFIIINGDNKVTIITKSFEYIEYDPKKHEDVTVKTQEVLSMTTYK